MPTLHGPSPEWTLTRDAVPSGFVVLRTPLLPFGTFDGWAEGCDSARAARDPARWAKHAQRAREYLSALLDDPVVREAVYLASPSLHERAAVWRANPDSEAARGVEHALVKELLDIKKNLGRANKLEAYHDAQERREDAQHMFTLGLMDLPDKAKIENLYWEISRDVVESFKGQAYVPEEIRKLEDSLGDQYLCNFSVFQSLLDHWALGQLFPIMPVSRLNERPTREATLVDITCDSDGQINKFIDLRDVRDTLPSHPLVTNGDGKQEPYYIGFFLMGAYQDIMGDLHNLFGRVNEVHVFLDPDEPTGYYVEEIIEGNTIVQCLASVQYDENELKRRMKAQIDEAIKGDRLKPSEGMRLLDDYERGLRDYTYLTF